jgi:hypothetical protein
VNVSEECTHSNTCTATRSQPLLSRRLELRAAAAAAARKMKSLQGEVHLNIPASKAWEMFTNNETLGKISPEMLSGAEYLEGDGSPGSLRIFKLGPGKETISDMFLVQSFQLFTCNVIVSFSYCSCQIVLSAVLIVVSMNCVNCSTSSLCQGICSEG